LCLLCLRRYCKGDQQNGTDVFYGLADTHDFDVS
jgi:hypothetical protein